MAMDDENEVKYRVLGFHIPNHKGKLVSVLGKVDSGGDAKSFKLRSTDNISVVVRVTERELLEGYIEVHGRVNDKNEIECSNYVVFPEEYTEKMNIKMYNDMVKLQHKFCEENKDMFQSDNGW